MHHVTWFMADPVRVESSCILMVNESEISIVSNNAPGPLIPSLPMHKPIHFLNVDFYDTPNQSLAPSAMHLDLLLGPTQPATTGTESSIESVLYSVTSPRDITQATNHS